MTELRASQLSDLAVVASWIGSEAECRLWCGTRISYPIVLATLADALEYPVSESWVVTSKGVVVAFGQLVPKAGNRFHLARLITTPDRRGTGLGRLIAVHILEIALTCKPAVISLNVFSENAPALSLYESLGFAPATRPPEESESPSVYMELECRASATEAPERSADDQ